VLHTLPLRTRQAVDDALPFEEFLFRLLADEVDRRDAKQLEARLRRAQFESSKSFEDFDFSFNPKIPKARLIDLATATFVTARSPTTTGPRLRTSTIRPPRGSWSSPAAAWTISLKASPWARSVPFAATFDQGHWSLVRRPWSGFRHSLHG
jgi:hypothetical protein